MVDLHDLKREAVAGTPFTFRLYTDSACTTPAGTPLTANIEDVE